MNKKNLLLSSAALLLSLSAHAQLSGDGYYRVQNTGTNRYISVCDDKADVNVSSTDVELGALKTYASLDRVLSDPGTVIYIKGVPGENYHYDFYGQGLDTYKLANGVHLTILPMGNNTYTASGSYKGASKTLYDDWRPGDEGYVTTDKTAENVRWYIRPVSSATDNYFGVKGEAVSDGKYYTTLYASFPFTLSEGMKAYYISEIDESLGVVIWDEIQGEVPGGCPVILQCNSLNATDNRLNLLTSSSATVNGNLLSGVYFGINDTKNGHVNYLPYSSNMRMIGRTKDGSLGFVKRNGLTMVPHNQAYLAASVSAPDQLKLMTRAEYEAYKQRLAVEMVTITADSQTREYGDENPQLTYTTTGATLRGVPELTTTADATSAPGTYPIVVSAGSVENTMPTYVAGTLTITKAPLTITALSCSREAGKDNPSFELTYTGFKNNDGTEKLSAQPVITCAANASSRPGTYPIEVSGAESDYYAITHVAGTLTVTEPDGIREVVSTTQPADVYTVTGLLLRRNATTLEELPKGVYVIAGRKVIVK